MKTIAIISSQAFSLVNFRGLLIADLVASKVRVYALAPDYTDEFRRQVIELGAMPVDFDLSRTGMSPLRDLVNMFKLAGLLLRLKPNVVLAYFIKPVIYGTLAAWLAHVPRRVAMIEGLGYVFTQTGESLSWSRKLLRQGVGLLYRLALSRAHRVVFLNRDDSADFLRAGLVDRAKLEHLEGIGVDIGYWLPTPPVSRPVTFLLAARLLREKGIIEYAEAARLVKKHYPQTRFILLGAVDPNPGSLSQHEVAQLVHDHAIEWPGHVDVKPWLAETSVYVLPSYREGLPRSTQEAMAMGRAVITTDVPGCRETVIDGINGFLVPVRDVAALVNAMLRFVRQPELIETMGYQSRQMVEQRFDAKKINPRLLRILDLRASFDEALPFLPASAIFGCNAKCNSEMPASHANVAISISVVSHGQIDLVALLMQDIHQHCQGERIELFLTLNIDESLPFDCADFFYPVIIIRNLKPKGFGSNHNHAFSSARGNYFCVVNPDIRFDVSPFSILLGCFANLQVGVVAPLVYGPSGEVEDSIRTFPTPKKILKKVFARFPQRDYSPGFDLIHPDWVGGMFMLFRRSVYEGLNGFDENYFLYYEDVDICARLKLSGFQAILCPASPIVHHAQRLSHSNIRYLRWHVMSMLRFFSSTVYRQLRRLRWA